MTIFESPYGGVDVPAVSITQQMFAGLGDDPDRVVLTDGPTGRQMTVAELKNGIMALAGGLNAAGRGRGKVTAIVAPNLPEFVLAWHGVAWAGGAITTINPTYTAAEVRHQLRDSGAELLITVGPFLETMREAVEGTKVTLIATMDGADGAASLRDLMGAPQTEQTPVDLARDILVLPYSSGTTGLPKGVMLSHNNLAVNVAQAGPGAGVRPGEATVAFLPFFHIYGMTALMNIYLSHGGALVTMPRFDLELFLTLVQDHRTPQLWLVPPVALALAKHPLVDQFDLSCVERGFSGAAPLDGETTRALAARLNCKMVQGYGMTEMSPVSHMSSFTEFREGASGRTLAGTQCRIVGDDGQDKGPGEKGELLVRGPQVMLGYLNNAQATAETLDPDGWLHTGDLAEFDDDGYIFLRDRVKELIKVSGFQVAPAELEATLVNHEEIADAGVIGIPDAVSGERPKAFVVRAAGSEISADDVKGHIAGQLSSYKHLAEVVFVEAIPKSASGKILRRELRELT